MKYDKLTGLIISALLALNPKMTQTDLANFLRDGTLPI